MYEFLASFLLALGGVYDGSININEFIETLTPTNLEIVETGEYTRFTNYSLIEENYNNFTLEGVIEDLTRKYPEYTWSCLGVMSTELASNSKPREMKGDYYSGDIIKNICNELGLDSSYGGCGPIALMGILDYFSNNLDYNEIVENPILVEDQIKIIKDVLNEVKTYEVSWGDKGGTLTFPYDMSKAFNNLTEMYGLQDRLEAHDDLSVIGNDKSYFLNRIVESIKKGYPVTLGIGSDFGNSPLYSHYSNIYSIATIVGVSDNETIYKNYLGIRANKAYNDIDYYYDSDILNSPLTTIITYDNADLRYTNLKASDFKDFVNDEGQGQYFYYEIPYEFRTLENFWINSRRLRTSYIENKHLVLSSNKEGAGEAYLNMLFYPLLTELSFDSSLWSGSEYIDNSTFTLQYCTTNVWIDYITYNLQTFSTSKDEKFTYYVLLPSNTQGIRFYSTTKNPTTLYNKGRICLDNITLGYDKMWW